MEEIKLLTWNGRRERSVPSFMHGFQAVGRALRKPFVFVDLDYSDIELRTVANEAGRALRHSNGHVWGAIDAPAFIPDEEAERLSARFHSTHPDVMRFWQQSEMGRGQTRIWSHFDTPWPSRLRKMPKRRQIIAFRRRMEKSILVAFGPTVRECVSLGSLEEVKQNFGAIWAGDNRDAVAWDYFNPSCYRKG